MSSKPTYVLVAGAWHSPECWDDVRTLLVRAGYEVVYAALPSVGAINGLADVGDDAKAVRTVLEGVLAEGNNIALCLHSYAGIPGSSACEGLGLADRKASGFSNGISSIAYISAFTPPKGLTLEAMVGGKHNAWCVKKGEYFEVDGPEDVFYHDVPLEKQAKAVAALKPHACNAFSDVKLEYEAFKYIPSTYLITEDDHCVPFQGQEGISGSAGPDVFRFQRIKSSHSPFYSKPEETVAFLRSVAGEEVQRPDGGHPFVA